MTGPEPRETLVPRCWLFSEGIDLSRVRAPVIARSPLTVEVGGGTAVVYRYGAVVTFGVEEAECAAFLETLCDDSRAPESSDDSALLHLAADGDAEGIDATGAITLADFEPPRLRVVAEVLSRSAVLSYYEAHLAGVIRDLEPPIDRLRSTGRLPARSRALLRKVGEVLHTEVRMIGRAEVAEKPEFVWDLPELDRLYLKLADEFELVERDRALSRKLSLVMRTSSILMDALSARRALGVEWAIFVLILIEVVMAL